MFLIQPDGAPAPDVWQALADPTRRTLIDRLAGGALTTSALCEGLPMTRFGVMKHLGVLERAGLVVSRRHGRQRLNHLNAAPLQALSSRWLSPRAATLAEGALRLSDRLGAPAMDNPAAQTGIVDVALEWPVSVSVQRLWEALFQSPQTWWPADHRAGPAGSVMTFEPKIGGHLKEATAEGAGLIWYSVIALEPLRSVDLAGHLATRYGGPATSLLHIEVVPGQADGTSILKLSDSVYGRIGPNLKASLTSGWQAIVGDGLVTSLG